MTDAITRLKTALTDLRFEAEELGTAREIAPIGELHRQIAKEAAAWSAVSAAIEAVEERDLELRKEIGNLNALYTEEFLAREALAEAAAALFACTTEKPGDHPAPWYFVKPGCGPQFSDALERLRALQETDR